MEFDAWEPFYEEILKDFVFSREKDEAVAVELDKLLGGNRIPESSLRQIIRGKEVTVAGNGPNVAHEIGGGRGGLLSPGEGTSGALVKSLPPALPASELERNLSGPGEAQVEGTTSVVH